MYVAYTGLIKRETSKALHAVINFVVVFILSASFIAYAPGDESCLCIANNQIYHFQRVDVQHRQEIMLQYLILSLLTFFI